MERKASTVRRTPYSLAWARFLDATGERGSKTIFVGVSMAIWAVLLFYIGQAGHPKAAFAGEISILTPDWADVDASLSYFEGGGLLAPGENARISVRASRCADPRRPACAHPPSGPIPIVVMFDDDAEMRADPLWWRWQRWFFGDDLTPGMRSDQIDGVDVAFPPEPVYPNTTQVVVANVEDGRELFWKGRANTNPVAQQNARRVVSSPYVSMLKCRDWSSSVVDAIQRPDPTGRSRSYGFQRSCRSDPKAAPADRLWFDVSEFGTLSDPFSDGAFRIDAAKPKISDENSYSPSVAVEWEDRADPAAEDFSFKAFANYVDVNEEAAGQTYVFYSGILIGLASAVVPAGLERWRASRRRSLDLQGGGRGGRGRTRQRF